MCLNDLPRVDADHSWSFYQRKKSEELRELLGLESVSLMINKSRLRWFGHVERKDDND